MQIQKITRYDCKPTKMLTVLSFFFLKNPKILLGTPIIKVFVMDLSNRIDSAAQCRYKGTLLTMKQTVTL
jgi:hypothetical protein